MSRKKFYGIIYHSPGHEKTGYLWVTDKEGDLRCWESAKEAIAFGRKQGLGVLEMDWWVQPIVKEMAK